MLSILVSWFVECGDFGLLKLLHKYPKVRIEVRTYFPNLMVTPVLAFGWSTNFWGTNELRICLARGGEVILPHKLMRQL